MRRAHDVATIRAAETALMAQLPLGTLMQRAATGVATACCELLGRVYGSRVVLLVGSGDNGGDALFAGAQLARRGAAVSAVLLGARAHESGLAALRAVGGRVGDFADVSAADLVLDGIVGIGGKGALREDAAMAVAQIPADALVVAVDLPSGVDADTGEVVGAAVRADVTVTFGTWKPGLLIDPGASLAGTRVFVDIGLDPHLPPSTLSALQDRDTAMSLPQLASESDKYRRGVVGVVAGSRSYTGAAVLAVGGALRSGIGMVRFVSFARPAELVRRHWPSAVVTTLADDASGVLDAGRVQAWVVGPGIGTDDAAKSLVTQVLSADVPVIVDADALTVLANNPKLLRGRRAPTVLTPHAGELARLLGLRTDSRTDIESRRLHNVRAAAKELDAVVLLKGSTTLACTPDGQVRANPTGTPWLASAGSGDVLAGMVGALLASGLSALEAASCAAYLHGSAGRLAATRHGAQAPLIPDDLVAQLPAAFATVCDV